MSGTATETDTDFEYVQSTGWKPKKGDVIEGTIQDISEGYSDYKQEAYPILTVQPKEGDPVDVHCFHGVLRSKILQLRPAIGEKVGIKFLGKTKKKGSTTEEVANYIVRVKGRRQADPYARMAGSAATAPPAEDASDDEDVPF